MSEFKVGDKVRVKDDAVQVGWLRRGGEAKITGIDTDGERLVYTFDVPATVDSHHYYAARYYASELEMVTSAAAAEEPKKVTAKEVRSLLHKARRALAVMDDPSVSYQEYARAHDKFAKAVEGVVNK